MVFIHLAVVRHHADIRGCNGDDSTGPLCKHADAGVNRRLFFHTGADSRSLGCEQRHCLPLHVRAHQGTVGIVVLKERDEGRRDRKDHLRRDIHIVKQTALPGLSHILIAAGYIFVQEMSLRIERLGSLRDVVVILLIGRHIDNFIRYNRILRIGLINPPERRLNKTILINPRVAGKGVNKSDVRAFRCLDRAHAAVMRIMNIADLKSGSVTAQAAGAEGGQTPLVSELTKRIVLVHELRQLGRSEEFLNRGSDRFDIDQRLRGHCVRILGLHAFAHYPLHSGKADPELILKQLPNGTDPAVAEMIDIIIISDAVFEMHIVVYRSKYIFPRNMLRDKLVDTSADRLLQLLLGSTAVQNLAKYRVINQLGYTQLPLLFLTHIDPAIDINHQGREDFRARDLFLALYILVMGKNRDGRNSFILYTVRDFSRADRSGFRNHFPALGVDGILSQRKSADPVA